MLILTLLSVGLLRHAQCATISGSLISHANVSIIYIVLKSKQKIIFDRKKIQTHIDIE